MRLRGDRTAQIAAVLLIVVVAGAGALRIARIGIPDRIIALDEQHYVAEAIGLLRDGSEQAFLGNAVHVDCETVPLAPSHIVHPPVAKWLIAAGISVFGCSPSGWRMPVALMGTLAVLLTVLIGLALTRSIWWGLLAGVLVAVDGLHFVVSRLAILDVVMGTFLLLSLWLALWSRTAKRRTPVLIAAGIAAGLAVGSKWTAIPAIPIVAWLALRRDRDTETSSDVAPAPSVRRRIGIASIIFAAIPLAVYVIAYLPWFAAPASTRPVQCEGRGGLSGWLCFQASSLTDANTVSAARGSDPTWHHSYLSQGLSLLWAGHPAAHENSRAAGYDHWIYGIPNPALWYPAIFIAVPWGIVRGLRRKDHAALAAAALALAIILPWVVLWRSIFLYYFAPAIPFLALALMLLLRQVPKFSRWPAAVVAAGVVLLPFAPIAMTAVTGQSDTVAVQSAGKLAVVLMIAAGAVVGLRSVKQQILARVLPGFAAALAVALFAYFYPVLAYVRTPVSDSVPKMWLKSDCLRTDKTYDACWL